MADNDYEEKRNFVRMTIQMPVSYRIKGGKETIYQATSGNLSANGLKMISSHAPKVGDWLELEMHTSHDRFAPFVAEGQVIRIETAPESSDLFQISVNLTKTA